MQEVTQRTGGSFGAVIIGLHRDGESRFCSFGAAAHQRDEHGRFIPPPNPEDRLFDDSGHPLPQAMRRCVRGMVLEGKGRRADDHGYFALPPARFDAVVFHVERIRADPPPYHAIRNNCVDFACANMEIAGLPLPPARPRHPAAQPRRPQDVGKILERWPQHPESRILIGQPLLLGL